MATASWTAWIGLLASLRAGTTDLALRPDRWETRAASPIVESVLKDPTSGPAAIDALDGRLASAEGSSGLIADGFDSLGVVPARSALVPASAETPGVPESLKAPIARLVARLTAAQTDLKLAVDSVTPEERSRARRAADAAIGQDPLSAPEATDFDAATRFDLPRLAAAGIAAAEAADEAAAALAGGPDRAPFAARWESPIGTVIVSSGDAELSADDLSRAGLVVRLGGSTRYRGPAAAAGEGEVRVVLDLGGPVVLESTGPAGGSGDFGIGLFYALGPAPHAADVGERSLGAARFGVGYAVFVGSSTRLGARRFSQGAAAFGVGALETRGDDDSLSLPMAGQGFATTRGAGFWRHRGNGLRASCGFEVPDAREALGSVSMGQGAGMGPRAFAAGGIGAARIAGDRAALSASYFSQGSGYWHGLGALFVRGDDASLQSRRYGLGTGVHMAVGALDVAGRRAQIATWGVGPGFGWDYGVGLFRLRGDEARVRSDWADGRSDLGGRAFALIEGDGDQLSLNGFGSGSFSRAQAGYGLATIRGRGNRLRAPGLAAPVKIDGSANLNSDPWGLIQVEGDVTLDPALALKDPTWPSPLRHARASAEAPAAAKLLDSSADVTPRARLARLLRGASADILDPRPAQGAALGLVSLAESDARDLAALLDADRFDELVWARLAASSLGPAAARAAAAEIPRAVGVRGAALEDWLRLGRVVESLPEAEAALKNPDWRLRRQAASVLGSMFDAEGGDEPGRLRLLREVAAGTATPERLGRKYLCDLYAALALCGEPSAQKRVELLEKSGSPFDAVAPDAVRAFLAEVSSRPACAAALASEDSDAARLSPRARGDLRAVASDPDDEVAAPALEALGKIGRAEDAPLLAIALSAPTSERREAAASGLARLGPAGRRSIERALKDRRPATRALAALAAAQSWDQDTFNLLGRALTDADAQVRATAVSALGAAPGAMAKAKEKLLPALVRMATDDTDLGVRGSAALAAAAISPTKPR